MYHLCTHSMPVDLIGTSLKITYELSTMLLRKKTHVSWQECHYGCRQVSTNSCTISNCSGLHHKTNNLYQIVQDCITRQIIKFPSKNANN